MAMLVKKVEVEFDNNEMTEAEVEKKMTLIEEKFSEKAIVYGFRTTLKSYASEGNNGVHNKIRFEFNGRDSVPMSDAIKIFEDWHGITKLDYHVYLRKMIILMI